MPIRNEERYIASTLDQLLAQDYPHDRYEIIVADGMSSDGTRDIVNDYCQTNNNIRLLQNPKCLSSAGRNICFKNGRGDIFLVIDGHCSIPTRTLFRSTIDCFNRSGAECLGRPQLLDPPGLSDFQIAVSLARGSKIGHGSDSLIYSNYEGYINPMSNGAIYKRRVFEIVGYVDESFDACEDVEFNYRVHKAGIKSYMSPALTVRYYPRENARALFKQMVRYGRGRRRLLSKHPETFSISGILPALIAITVLVLPFVAWLYPPGLWQVLGPLYAAYILVIAMQSIALSLRHGTKYFSGLMTAYVTIHFGLGLGFISKPRSEAKCKA